MTMTKRAGLFRFQLPVLNPDADIYETLNMSQFSPNIKIVIYLTCCQCLVVHWFCMNVNQKKPTTNMYATYELGRIFGLQKR